MPLRSTCSGESLGSSSGSQHSVSAAMRSIINMGIHGTGVVCCALLSFAEEVSSSSYQIVIKVHVAEQELESILDRAASQLTGDQAIQVPEDVFWFATQVKPPVSLCKHGWRLMSDHIGMDAVWQHIYCCERCWPVETFTEGHHLRQEAESRRGLCRMKQAQMLPLTFAQVYQLQENENAS